MKTVFADSFYFFALANPNDPAHARAAAFVKKFTGRMVTTGWVLTELLAYHAMRLNTRETTRAVPFSMRVQRELIKARS